jgi:hypothetical protein
VTGTSGDPDGESIAVDILVVGQDAHGDTSCTTTDAGAIVPRQGAVVDRQHAHRERRLGLPADHVGRALEHEGVAGKVPSGRNRERSPVHRRGGDHRWVSEPADGVQPFAGVVRRHRNFGACVLG